MLGYGILGHIFLCKFRLGHDKRILVRLGQVISGELVSAQVKTA